MLTTPKSNPSRTGDLAEAAFLLKASTLGFGVARPWGNAERYDFILDNGQRLLRVQVKCTTTQRARGYDVQPIYSTYQKRKIIYTPADIDALVAHVVPLDIWYVLPVSALAGHPSLRFYPQGGCRRPRFEHFREAWHLLK